MRTKRYARVVESSDGRQLTRADSAPTPTINFIVSIDHDLKKLIINTGPNSASHAAPVQTSLLNVTACRSEQFRKLKNVTVRFGFMLFTSANFLTARVVT